MAQRKKRLSKKKRKIQFELTPTGAAAAAVVCVSLFFWMFFLGVWAGQSVLGPPVARKTASTLPHKKVQKKIPVLAASATKKSAQKNASQQGASFFTLQIGAFRDKSGAMHEIVRWKVRGEKPFMVKASDENGTLYRVCLGKFSELAAANGFAGKYVKKGQQPYIILLPAAQFANKK